MAQQTLSGLFTKEPEKATVYADHRERASGILDLIGRKGVEVKEFQLQVGDFLVSEDVAIERKEANDFVSSMLDGRLFGQARELADNFSKPVILLEGDPYGQRNVNENALRGALASLATRFRVPVIFTRNVEDSAAFIALLARREQLEDKKWIRLRGEKRNMSVPQQQQFIVESLPSVGPALAQALLKHFGSVEKVFKASEKHLKEVDGVGDVKAKQVRKVLTKKYGENDG
ncbi:hypothetical protein HYS54_02050 [Candidatus Micrarchaeota archaeon]|nr:hypothetical protein [Candidatus Micrarchaeota archaeon]